MFRLIFDTGAYMYKQVSPYSHTRSRKSANPGSKKKKTQITDDSFFAFAPCNICNLESVRSLSPSSFKEDALIVDNHKAGNTAQTNQGIKRPENVMDILVCRHMQEKFITSAGIYGRGSMMLRLLMDR